MGKVGFIYHKLIEGRCRGDGSTLDARNHDIFFNPWLTKGRLGAEGGTAEPEIVTISGPIFFRISVTGIYKWHVIHS